MGRLAEALAKFNETSRLEPKLKQASYHRGNVHRDLGQFEQALQSYNEAIRAVHQFADIYAGQQAFDLAATELEAQAELTPDNLGLFRRMAWIAEQRGDNVRAIAANEALVEHQPTNTGAWLALGSLYAAVGQPEKSGEAFTRVVELDPANAYTTFFNIGVLIENKPNPTPAEERRALDAFRKAVEIKPDYAKAHRHLAYALLRTGDLKGARQELERYLEIEPDAGDSGEVKALVSSLPN